MNRADAIELNPCPCGVKPSKLCIEDGSTYRWRYVSANCGNASCPGWMIEVRVDYAKHPDEIEDICIKEWNESTKHLALPPDTPKREAVQRERMRERFSNRATTPPTADFDLIAPNDDTGLAERDALVARIDSWGYGVPTDIKLHALLTDIKKFLEAL